eukprot:CCRYP_001344-RA/>CCRYP_001344-RA protein AED:0.12 eAED:0.12 QI:0/0/0/1/1/1/2/0/395
MGYDSNIKSNKAERRQRSILLLSMAGLAIAAFVVVSLLHKEDPSNSTYSNAASVKTISIDANADGSKPKVLRATTEHNGDIKLEAAAALHVAKLDEEVRAIKKTGVIMETDPHALEITSKLQRATRELIKLRYGEITDRDKNFRVRLELEFQSTIPDFEEKGKDGSITIEMAPIELIPCSTWRLAAFSDQSLAIDIAAILFVSYIVCFTQFEIAIFSHAGSLQNNDDNVLLHHPSLHSARKVFNFLEIARTWKSGAFHRNAGHVLQAMSHSDVTKPMPFQEYRSEYPHKKGTIGYAGRPSGPEFYISIEDNTKNHGPGSQQKKNPYEADSIIGTVVEGMDDVVPRIHTMPGHEFIGDKNKWVLIKRMVILVPGDGPEADKDGYVEFSKSPLELPQ